MRSLSSELRRTPPSRSKNRSVLYQRLAQGALSLGRTPEAIAYYEEATKADIQNILAVWEYSVLCYREKQFEAAQKGFRSLLLHKFDRNAGIDRADMYYYLSDIASKEGDVTKARSLAERALAENEQHESARKLLSEIVR